MNTQKIENREAINKRVCLLGFGDKNLQESYGEALRNQGHTVVRVPNAAELILLGPGSNPARFEGHRRPGLKLVMADEFMKLDKLANIPNRLVETVEEAQNAIESDGTHVSVCGVRLPKRRAPADPRLLVPAERFHGLVFDSQFMRGLRQIFLALHEGKNIALSGPTATAKTTLILFAGHLLGHPVRRLNLCSSSDAGDLVGRFIPSTGQDAISFQDLDIEDEALSAATLAILRRARSQGRALSQCEKVRILANEKINAPAWTFAEGAVPACLRDGSWLILDELNLIDPAVAERISPALEIPATLALTENDGEVFGPGASPVHQEYRAFAAMNDTSYSGRSILSEALRRRFGIWISMQAPSFAESRHYLHFLAYGEHPIVRIDGRSWQMPASTPILPELGRLPSPASALDALAKFHSSMCEAAVGQSIGKHKREPYVYTREHLCGCATRVARRIGEGAAPSLDLLKESIQLFYLAGLDSKTDLAAVKNFLRASGLA
jgi:MoxR-like ATPase